MGKGGADLPPLPYFGRAAMTDSEKLDLILKEIEGMKKEIKEVKITIENETNQNIKVIAEGHMILDRKLDEALKTLHPNTMYYLKVNHLDGEVKKIKEAIGMA